MYNNNNNKSQQYLFKKIAGDQKGQTAYRLTGRVVVLGRCAAIYILFGNVNKRKTARLSKLFRVGL